MITLGTLSLGLPFASSSSSRSHPQEVRRLAAEGHACPPLHSMPAWYALPPASLPGSTLSLDAPAVREQMAPHQARSSLLSFASSSKTRDLVSQERSQ